MFKVNNEDNRQQLMSLLLTSNMFYTFSGAFIVYVKEVFAGWDYW